MKTFQSIQEERGEKAFKQAISMGLKYSGFGYWKDPQTGETKFKTENDTLVPVEQDESSEKYTGSGPADGVGMPDGGGGMGMQGGGMQGAGGMLQMPGMGGTPPGDGSLGAGEPGEEQVEKDHAWEPGPDGDTCVGPEADKPGEIPKDSYVGRTNFLKWAAGPDGDNMTTVSIEDMMEETEEPPANKARERMGKIMARKPASGETNARAQSAMNKMADGNPTEFGKQVESMVKIANRKPRGGRALGIQSPSDNEAGKENDMWRKALKLPNIQKEADVIKGLNQESRGLVQDPNYKMDQYDEDEGYLDEGSFGSAFEDKNGNVIKRGEIGIRELNALSAMKDNPNFPTLINANFETPFRKFADVEDDEYNYEDSDYSGNFFNSQQTARGSYAMTQAKGSPIADVNPEEMSEKARDNMMRSFWKARGDFHKAGFAHNDMHGGNVFVDPETGEVNIIDLGLAQEDKMAALMEALGGLDYEQGNDGQLDTGVAGASLPSFLMDKFDVNRGNMEQEMMDGMGDLDFDDPKTDDIMKAMAGMQSGGIRMKGKQLQELRDSIPFLKEDGNIQNLIKTLYKEVGQSELADRMGAAFDSRQLDTKTLMAANAMRKQKGKSQIAPGRGVIPSKNMDFDD